jgi:hypothetical protein
MNFNYKYLKYKQKYQQTKILIGGAKSYETPKWTCETCNFTNNDIYICKFCDKSHNDSTKQQMSTTSYTIDSDSQLPSKYIPEPDPETQITSSNSIMQPITENSSDLTPSYKTIKRIRIDLTQLDNERINYRILSYTFPVIIIVTYLDRNYEVTLYENYPTIFPLIKLNHKVLQSTFVWSPARGFIDFIKKYHEHNFTIQSETKTAANNPIIQSTIETKLDGNNPIIQSTIETKLASNNPIIQSTIETSSNPQYPSSYSIKRFNVDVKQLIKENIDYVIRSSEFPINIRVTYLDKIYDVTIDEKYPYKSPIIKLNDEVIQSTFIWSPIHGFIDIIKAYHKAKFDA